MGNFMEAILHCRMCLLLQDIKSYHDRLDSYVMGLDFNEALECCLTALEIQKKYYVMMHHDYVMYPVQVASDRRLVGILFGGLEESDKNDDLTDRILKNWNLTSDSLQAEIDAANTMTCLGRYDEAAGILKNVVQHTDKDSGKRALVLISMAKVLFKQDKYAYFNRCLEISLGILDKIEKISPLEVAEAITEISTDYVLRNKEFADLKRRLKNSLQIHCKRKGISPMEVAEAYSEISIRCETTNEFLTALSLLKRLLDLLKKHPQLWHSEGSVSARIGRLLLRTGEVQEAACPLIHAAKQLKDSVDPNPVVVGYVYNNLGVAYLELDRPQLAVKMLAAAKDIMDVSLGPHHEDAIVARQNLSKAYAEMGSYAVAVEFQQEVIDAWGSHGPSAEDEFRKSRRILEQIKEIALGTDMKNELHLKAFPLPMKAGASLSKSNI